MKNSHLTKPDRQIIETGIRNGSTKAAIAETIGKDGSTIGKEIRLHRALTSKCKMPLECSAYKKCPYGRCCDPGCPGYVPFKCTRRDRSPGACNGCAKRNRCRFDKYDYFAGKAQGEYEEALVDSRLGANLTAAEAKEIGGIVAPLLKRGLSPYRILEMHPELGICEKTLYNYINGGVLHEVSGIAAIDARRIVSRRARKKKAARYKKRADRKYLKGRTYNDYLAYVEEYPDARVVQMDTVYNDGSEGPFIQTFKLMGSGVLLAVLHREKTAEAMKEGLDFLESALGKELFRKYFEVVLTDRGSEFADAEGMETSGDGCRRTRVFYCDPMSACQKGSLENKHIELRYVLPKGADLYDLGLTGQDALCVVLSHVDSAPCRKLGGRSPLEFLEFMDPEMCARLAEMGIKKIAPDEIVLMPRLLKNHK